MNDLQEFSVNGLTFIWWSFEGEALCLSVLQVSKLGIMAKLKG